MRAEIATISGLRTISSGSRLKSAVRIFESALWNFNSESKAGCKVNAAASETRGTRADATPRERTKGIGTSTKEASVIATVILERATVLPALAIVLTMEPFKSSGESAYSLRKRKRMSNE